MTGTSEMLDMLDVEGVEERYIMIQKKDIKIN